MSGFRGFSPYDEGAGDSFHGRVDEIARVTRLLGGEARVVVLAGPSGIGKTSLLRAGLAPALARRGAQVVTVGAYDDLDGEILRAASRLGVTPPIPNQSSADYLARIARDSQNGLVLTFDHLEDALSDEVGRGADLGELLARVVENGGNRLRLLLSIDDTSFARLDQLRDAGAGAALAASAWMTLPGLTQEQVSEILERTAIQSGTFFENGLASAVAADLCRAGRCRPLDLQLVARAMVDLRLTSVRKFQRSGGAAVLPALFLERVCAESGGRVAREALLAAAERRELVAEDLGSRGPKARAAAAEALAALKQRGLLRARARGRREAFALAHPGLRETVEQFAIEDRARAASARRSLRRRLTAGERLRLPELWAVHRYLGGALAPDEQVTFGRSVRRNALQIGAGVVLAGAILFALVANMRRSYTLGFEPRDGGGAARVVVRLGRDSFLSVLPNHPRFGTVIADTGFSASGLGADTAARIGAGKASGTLDASGEGGAHGVPAWLREVLNGLRPVPRGVAKALMGEPDGVTALKQAFSDPLARRETLEALAVIGRGRAGEDEILAAALTDSAPEIRRRGVEVAASIDRRQGSGAHGATLRSALGDKSLDVRAAVLRETATLPPAEAASILTVALRDPDPAFRHGAEDATNALAERAPAAAVGALEQVLQSPDGGVRRAGLALLETIAARDPAACAAALQHVVANEQAPEDARVAALLILRRAGVPSAELRPLLEKAVRPEASPRLRAAALPLYARLVTPEQAEEIARTEMKGAATARAAGAAVWGTVAMTRPDLAAKPLKGLLYDASIDTRLEAARSFGYLKREGLELVEKALKDGNAEVEKAAVESAVALAPVNAYQVGEMLGHAVKNVRPTVRHDVIAALARIGDTKPAAVIAPLAHALKDQDVGTRAAAANAFCALAEKNAPAVSPYLRIAARDDRDEVRTAAAACLGELSEADPKGAARIAAELGDAAQPTVRVAAAEALGRLGAKARDLAVPALLKLVGDPERAVRVAAERSLGSVAEKAATTPVAPGAGISLVLFDGKRAADAEHALNGALTQGDAQERRVVVSAAAKAGLVGVLHQAAADGDESVRLDAIRAAGALGGHALEVVRGAIDDRSNAVRAEATRILAAVSGAGAREVLPIFESMLRGGDKAAREAAVIGVGDLQGAGEAGARLLGEALGQRSEALRTATAHALGRLAEREPEEAQPYLERAVRDSSYDVRAAAIPGLALAWSRRQSAGELERTLIGSEADSTARFVALEALVIKAQGTAAAKPGRATGGDREAARQALQRAAEGGPPLARLAAQIGRAFLEAQPPDLHVFIERLLGG